MARGDLGAELPIEEVPLLQVISMPMHTASFHEPLIGVIKCGDG